MKDWISFMQTHAIWVVSSWQYKLHDLNSDGKLEWEVYKEST